MEAGLTEVFLGQAAASADSRGHLSHCGVPPQGGRTGTWAGVSEDGPMDGPHGAAVSVTGEGQSQVSGIGVCPVPNPGQQIPATRLG